MVVVILIIWVISILFIYMAFLACLDPILNRNSKEIVANQIGYKEHYDEREEWDNLDEPEAEELVAAESSVISRWKRQVREQRKNIYDRHAMLNWTRFTSISLMPRSIKYALIQ